MTVNWGDNFLENRNEDTTMESVCATSMGRMCLLTNPNMLLAINKSMWAIKLWR